jgi:hypothetical protein
MGQLDWLPQNATRQFAQRWVVSVSDFVLDFVLENTVQQSMKSYTRRTLIFRWVK